MTPIVLIVAMLTTYRFTLLLTHDKLTEPIRTRIFGRYVFPLHEPFGAIVDTFATPVDGVMHRWFAECRCRTGYEGDETGDVIAALERHVQDHAGEQSTGPWWLKLLDCYWCMSFWLAWPVVWSAWCFGDRSWWFVPAAAFAGSAVTGILATYAKPES